MPTSEARVAANRRNAQRSTGPKTPEGKANSRQNALKHGLTATVVDLDDSADQAAPESDGVITREWLQDQVRRTARQIRRGERIEDRLRLQNVWRASATWDDDRRLDAENIAVRLGCEPSRTVMRLRQTPQGCDWLIERWAALARVAEANDDAWTDEQTRLAHDLLGTPPEARDDSAFRNGKPTPQRAAVARRLIAELQECQTIADEADEIAQVQAAGDLVDLPTPELARLRRYEVALHKRLQWLMTELKAVTTVPAVAREITPPPATLSPPVAPVRNEPIAARPANETNPTPPAAASPLAPPQSTWSRQELALMVGHDSQSEPASPETRRTA